MKTVLSALLLFAFNAYAHVEPGIYRGINAAGQPCELRAIEMKFENGLHHPLTERVVIDYGGEVFTIGHPSAIDRANGQVTFNHDLFQGILPNASGAKALTIEMIHSQSFEGPGAFEVIDHNWRTKKSESLRCTDLKFYK